MKQLEFIRWGGLSPVKQERYVPDKILYDGLEHEEFGFFGTFHRPPARKGVYVFIPGFVEMFLVAWKLYDKYDKIKKEYEHAKRFMYSGKIWTHIYEVDPEITYYRRRDCWYETDTDSLPHLIKVHKWRLCKEACSDEWMKMGVKDFSSFMRAWKLFDKDHFEVFIERI